MYIELEISFVIVGNEIMVHCISCHFKIYIRDRVFLKEKNADSSVVYAFCLTFSDSRQMNVQSQTTMMIHFC